MRVVNQAELVLQPEEEIPEWILAKVEEEDGEGEDSSKEERSARMWAMSKHQFGIGGKNSPGYFTAAWIIISSTRNSLFCWLLLLFHYEENVEKVCADDCKVEPEYCGPTNLVFKVCSHLHPERPSAKSECIDNNQPGCSFLSGGCVNKEGVDAKEEDKVASSQVLEALKQQVLHLQLLEPERVDHVDNVEEKVTGQAHKNQRLSRKSVGNGSSEEGHNYGGEAL